MGKGVLLAAIACLAGGPALAQGESAREGTTPQEQGGSLSQRLSKSGGVIHPKGNVDPGIRVPAPVPHPNSTPVIPPAATGGNSAK